MTEYNLLNNAVKELLYKDNQVRSMIFKIIKENKKPNSSIQYKLDIERISNSIKKDYIDYIESKVKNKEDLDFPEKIIYENKDKETIKCKVTWILFLSEMYKWIFNSKSKFRYLL